VAAPVLAGGGKNRVQNTGAGVCLVNPNPVSNDVPGWYTVSGAGFTPGEALDLFLVSPSGGIGIIFTVALGDGTFHTTSYYAPYLSEDGRWSVKVYQQGDRRMTVLASCSFTVT